MKNTLMIFIGLLMFSATVLAQGFVEEFRSQPGRRPPTRAWYSYGTAAFRITDLNGNGSPDMPFMLGQSLAVYDGKTREQILELPDVGVYGKIEWHGFFKFYDKQNKVYEATHLVVTSVTAGANPLDLRIFNVSTGEIVWQMQNVRLMTVADLDNDNRPELIVGDLENKQVVMVGWENNGSSFTKSASPTEWPSTTSSAYELSLKFESDPNTDLAYDGELVADSEGLDVNGDGVPEIIMLIEDNNGDPAGMAVRDGVTRDVKWQFDFPDSGPVHDDILRGFHGFFDVDGDGQREAIFGNRTAVTLDQTPHRVDENFEILAVHDIDDDGFADFIGRGLEDSTVQVWGADNATSVSEEDLAIAGFQLQQNYPNPFNPQTTISYSLEHPGPVELKIYDVLGRLVRTLVNENRPAGEYSVLWNGRDESGRRVASGSYFYQLTAGKSQSTRRMILLK